MSQHFVRHPKILGAWTVIALAGVVLGWREAQSRRTALMARVIDDTRRSAVAFEPVELRQLTGSAADLASPLLVRVRSRLNALCTVDGRVHAVYLLRSLPESGKMIFLAAADRPGTPTAATPGEAFRAAELPGLQEAIRTGGVGTHGPVNDKSDRWVTGYAAISPATGTGLPEAPREILGVDFDASGWSGELWAAGIQRALFTWIVSGLPLLAWIVIRRQAEQREVIRNLSEAMEQSRSALLIVDLAGRIEYANRGLCRQTGHQRRELLGRSWRDPQMPAPPDEVLTDIFASVRAGRPWEGEWLNRRKDGTHYPARGIVTPVKHRDGTITCFVALFDDVTESKRREAELREARDLAEAGDRAKSRFLATMSHEVRTPLNGIVGFTSLLLETPLVAEQREFVQTIRASGESLIQLTGDILDFARIESGKLKLDPMPCDPRETVEEALDLLAAKAAGKKIELLHRVATDVPAAIVTDAGRLRQILVNLVGNAVKFTPAGEVEVVVRLAKIRPADSGPTIASAAAPDDCILEFSVRDTGIGIAPEHHEKLFKPFSQVDESSTRRFSGTGLGLAICRSLVQMLGGEIACTSTPGRGSMFTFTISAPIAMLPPPRHELGKLRIGLAAQPGALRQELVELVSSWGNPVVEADTPAELAGKTWDIALVDASEPVAAALAETAEALPGLAPERTFGLVPISLPTELRGRLHAHFRLLINKPVHHETLFSVVSGAAPSTAPAIPSAAQFGLNVLVAEDNVVNQRLMQRVLGRLGCTSTIVENGREALLELTDEAKTYDVLLLDMHMPEMDGLTALRAIRDGTAGDQVQNLWIIALTADAREKQRAQALKAGLNDYLTKPLNLADLEGALRRYCAERMPAPPVSPPAAPG